MQAYYKKADGTGDKIAVIGHRVSDCRAKFATLRRLALGESYAAKGKNITSVIAAPAEDGVWVETIYSDQVTIQSVTRINCTIKSALMPVYREVRGKNIGPKTVYDGRGNKVAEGAEWNW